MPTLITQEDEILSRLATIELHQGELKFSAGHFMIYPDNRRESLHGHDYQVSVAFHTLIQNNGMCFDIRNYKQRLHQLCAEVDYRFILPSKSDYLRIEDAGDKWVAHVHGQSLPFLKTDAVVLPITNATLEELSYWVLQQLIQNPDEIKNHNIQGIDVRVFNGRGEAGLSTWKTTA